MCAQFFSQRRTDNGCQRTMAGGKNRPGQAECLEQSTLRRIANAGYLRQAQPVAEIVNPFNGAAHGAWHV